MSACELTFKIILIAQPFICLGFFWFGYWWYGRKERLNDEILRGAYDAGTKWIEEWKAAGKPVGEWPGLRPPTQWNVYWRELGK